MCKRMIFEDLSDKFWIFLFWPVLAIFRPKSAKMAEKWPKRAKKSKNQKFVRQIFRNHYFAPLVQISGPENDLRSSYFHFSDFPEISFEISLNYRPFSRRSTCDISTTDPISLQRIELFQLRKKRQLRLTSLYHICES